MDQRYNDVYETLFAEFPLTNHYFDDVPFQRLYPIPAEVVRNNLREVRNYIQTVSSSPHHNEKMIRPDAKLFLISNYYNMVLLPVLVLNYQNEKRFPLNDEFKERIRKDVDIIFEEASHIDSNEISSHSVIDSISRIWSKLYTTVGMSWSDSNKY